MDRPIIRRKRSRIVVALLSIALALVIAAAAFSARALGGKTRTLSVDRATVVTDVVQSGPMIVQLHGTGTLIAEEARWLPAQTAGRVERVHVDAGGAVEAGTAILELSNPEVAQRALETTLATRAAEAETIAIAEQWTSQVLTQRAELAAAEAASDEARLRVEADRELLDAGLLPAINMSIAEGAARQLRTRYDVARAKLESAERLRDASARQQSARLEQLRAMQALRASDAEALRVRAGVRGVVQGVSGERGQQVAAGATLALVADPSRLKARILIPETQAQEIRLGQRATIDTRFGLAGGGVARVDAAASDGNVAVDVRITGALPAGVRPDLNVDGTIDIVRFPRTLHVGGPASAPSGRATVFRVTRSEAVRTTVTFGRLSATRVQIISGLAPGDVIVTSDTTEWQGVDRIAFN